MANQKESQKKKSGHGLIAALAIVLVVLCAGLGYFIWKHKDNVPANANPQTSQENNANEKDSNASD